MTDLWSKVCLGLNLQFEAKTFNVRNSELVLWSPQTVLKKCRQVVGSPTVRFEIWSEVFTSKWRSITSNQRFLAIKYLTSSQRTLTFNCGSNERRDTYNWRWIPPTGSERHPAGGERPPVRHFSPLIRSLVSHWRCLTSDWRCLTFIYVYWCVHTLLIFHFLKRIICCWLH